MRDGEYYRCVCAHGEIHQWRQHVEFAAEHIPAAVGAVGRHDQFNRRDTIHHRAGALRKNPSATDVENRSGADSVGD